MQPAMVLDQTQAGQDTPSLTAPPPHTQPARVPGLTDAGPASKEGLTRQPEEAQRSAEGRPAAPSQPAEGPRPAQMADAGDQAGPGRQAPAQATGVAHDCASIKQISEAENAREAEATAQMVADVASRAMPAVVQGLAQAMPAIAQPLATALADAVQQGLTQAAPAIAQPLVTAMADAVVRGKLQAAAAARIDRAQAEAKAVSEAAQVGTRFC